MRVLFVRHTTLGRPGAAACHYYPVMLSGLEHEVTMMARAGGDGSALAKAGVRVVEVEKNSSWLRSLRRVAREIQPDIVHVFIHAGCGIYPYLMRSASNPKFILDIRSPLLRTGFVRRLVQLKNKIEVIGYDAICSPGVESGHTVVGDRYKLYWIPVGVDMELFPEKRLETTNRFNSLLKLVYIGSLDAKRRIDEMLAGVIDAASKVDLSLDVYGDGNARGMLESHVDNSGLSHRIRFQGAINRAELFHRLPEYDMGLAYVPRALYDPAPPLKTLEYMAAGLPVVATDTIGNRMFVMDGENGVLTSDSPEAYAEGIVRLANATWRRDAPAKARETAREFDWQAIAKNRLLPLYEELLGS